jgi:hypothetical protein
MKLSDAIALAAVAAGLFAAPNAAANGRFPRADQLVIDPASPAHLVVRTTFGFLESYDAGKTWRWICEEIVGTIGSFDPPLASTGDGTLVVTVPFEGVSVSHDRGCSWEQAPSPLASQLVIDMTLEPNEPSSLLVLTSTNDPDAGTDAGPAFISRVVETKDNARTWVEVGTLLPSDFIASTIEVAPSDPNRMYVGGVAGEPPVDAVLRSDDRGMSWTRTTLTVSSAGGGAFVSAIDPQDPDRLWVRVPTAPVDAFGMAPTTLLLSQDKAATFMKLAETAGSMLGFALSPDGKTLAYGGPGDGVFVGPSTSNSNFTKVSTLMNRCLTWSAAGLYACFTEPYDPFSIGLSTDRGGSFAPVYRFVDTCPQQCPDDSAFATTCRSSWTTPPGGAGWITQATGANCSVSWARVVPMRDAGSDDGGAPADAKKPDTDASVETPSPANPSCGCRMGVDRDRGWPFFAALAIVGFAARRKKQGRRVTECKYSWRP